MNTYNEYELCDFLVDSYIPLEDLYHIAMDNFYGINKKEVDKIFQIDYVITKHIHNIMKILLHSTENFNIKDDLKHYILKMDMLIAELEENIQLHQTDEVGHDKVEQFEKIILKIISKLYELYHIELHSFPNEICTMRSAIKKIISNVINLIFSLKKHTVIYEDINNLEIILKHLNN